MIDISDGTKQIWGEDPPLMEVCWTHHKSLSRRHWGDVPGFRGCEVGACWCWGTVKGVRGPRGSQYLRRASHTLTPLSTLHPETSQLYSQHTWQKCNFSLIMLFAENLEIPKLFTHTHIKWWTLHLSNSTLLLCATWRNPSKATPTRLFYLRISEVEMPKMSQHCSCIIMTKETLMTKRKFGDVGTKWSAFIQTEK